MNSRFFVLILFLALFLLSVFYASSSRKIEGCYSINDKLASKIVYLEINASEARFYDNFSNILYEGKVADSFLNKHVEIGKRKVNFYFKSNRIYFENFLLPHDESEMEEIWFEEIDCTPKTILLGPYSS